ncbi:MAG: ADP-ribosylglycohydrolase family protein [Anaerolineaceae bacterium]|nr:ADP-ribosylglycohydrolase family protein [Anaerolineaceae bacterium]
MAEKDKTPLPAWQLERELRDSAIPVDRRIFPSHWDGSLGSGGDDLIKKFWGLTVPGSSAPEVPYQALVQAQGNKGYDVSMADALIPEGLQLLKEGKTVELRALTARLMKAVREAPTIPDHPYHQYRHPQAWEEVKAAMPAAGDAPRKPGWKDAYSERIYQGWMGQLAGGSFGTAIEGYIGPQIAKVYGEVTGYITQPETMNDDVVYELVLLDVFERMGHSMTSDALGLEWIKQLPFGYSAEGIALRNLNMGIFPPESGSFLNPYSNWIGAQMRGMVCGMLAPLEPLEAARLAHIDGVVSHAENGVYGEMYAAVLTSLAFEMADTRALLLEAGRYIPAGSEYAAKLEFIYSVLKSTTSPAEAWPVLDKHFECFNWIHAYPNLAADAFSLWYCGGDFSRAMTLLAIAGYDVDCNGGLVGNVLGVIRDVPPAWSEPIGDLLETYVPGKEKLSIKELAERTARLARA